LLPFVNGVHVGVEWSSNAALPRQSGVEDSNALSQHLQRCHRAGDARAVQFALRGRAPQRAGSPARYVMDGEIEEVIVDFDANGSLATTHESQGV
jgi:hypothetical protein